MYMKDIMIVKRNGNLEKFDPERVRNAVRASAERVMVDLTDDAMNKIVNKVVELLETQTSNPTVEQVHSCCEVALETINLWLQRVIESIEIIRRYYSYIR